MFSLMQNDMNFFIGLYVLLGNLEKIIELIKPFFYLLLYKCTTYRYFTIVEREKATKFKGQLKSHQIFALSYDCEFNPIKYFLAIRDCQLFYIAYVSSYTYDCEVHLFIKTEDLEKVLGVYSTKNTALPLETYRVDDKDTFVFRKSDDNDVKMYYRYGEYRFIRYGWRDITINTKVFFDNQFKLFNRIKDEFHTRGKQNVTCLISGSTGTGKTYFAYLLARELNASVCSTFDPSSPGDNIDNLYDIVTPTKGKPLIIVMDEVDILIERIHKNEVVLHKQMSTLVHNKRTWNQFLDNFDYGIYPNVILLMNTNKKKSDIDYLDKSYLRNGRIDMYAEF